MRYYYRYNYIGWYDGSARECTCFTNYETYREACEAAAERVGKLKRRGWTIMQVIIEMVQG